MDLVNLKLVKPNGQKEVKCDDRCKKTADSWKISFGYIATTNSCIVKLNLFIKDISRPLWRPHEPFQWKAKTQWGLRSIYGLKKHRLWSFALLLLTIVVNMVILVL
ncbi:hypothetical protein DMA11_21200 [Marinilabiliaceae bacterium JC017]|nr:hypothetical protein DMA11_21200 [Marinilabiliaceae bacterium JC017]